jgi:hypothetical protein
MYVYLDLRLIELFNCGVLLLTCNILSLSICSMLNSGQIFSYVNYNTIIEQTNQQATQFSCNTG